MKFVGVEERRVRRENPSRPPLLPLCRVCSTVVVTVPWKPLQVPPSTSKYLGLVPFVSTGGTVAMAGCCMIPSASGWPALLSS